MGNRIRMRRRRLRDLLRVDGYPDFHRYLVAQAIGRYRASLPAGSTGLGSVLAVGANWREARLLREFPFDHIQLSGLTEPDDALREELSRDARLDYERQNLECVALSSRSFDLVFCKEALHHLARPVLGLLEVLRLCRRGALVIEPHESLAGRLFASMGLASVYESDQAGNADFRDNYVYRWSRRQLVSILNSYYLESGYGLDLTVGWLSSPYNAGGTRARRRAAALAGWAMSLVPGSRGNYMTALITPGSNLPGEPIALQTWATSASSENISGQARASA